MKSHVEQLEQRGPTGQEWPQEPADVRKLDLLENDRHDDHPNDEGEKGRQVLNGQDLQQSFEDTRLLPDGQNINTINLEELSLFGLPRSAYLLNIVIVISTS